MQLQVKRYKRSLLEGIPYEPFFTGHLTLYPAMLVLVIYDIPDNKRRTKLATFLEGYGRRVQKKCV